jgi:predicted glycosyltransferase
LNKRGHRTVLLARNYGENLELLEEYGMDHYIFSNPPESKWGKIANMPFDLIRAIKYLKRNEIEIITGFGIFEAFSSAILRKIAISFNDSEYSIKKFSGQLQLILLSPFVDVIITPTWFRQNLGSKQIRINCFKELAYLHPKYFKPRSDVINMLGSRVDRPYILFRFNNFDAIHDIGVTGFTMEDKIKLVRELEIYADIFISSEGKIIKELQQYVIKIPKNRIHDALFYAGLFITDTQTMATEAAILGTPTIRCNKFVGENDMGNFIELEKRYSLLFNVKNSDQVLEIARELLKIPDLKLIYKQRRDRLLKETIDITSFFTEFIENYPISFQDFKR